MYCNKSIVINQCNVMEKRKIFLKSVWLLNPSLSTDFSAWNTEKVLYSKFTVCCCVRHKHVFFWVKNLFYYLWEVSHRRLAFLIFPKNCSAPRPIHNLGTEVVLFLDYPTIWPPTIQNSTFHQLSALIIKSKVIYINE